MNASVLCTNKRMYLESQIFLESNQCFVPGLFFSGYEQSKDKDKCLLKDKTGVRQKVLVSLRSSVSLISETCGLTCVTCSLFSAEFYWWI